jgi:hypothetical protein
MCELWCEINDWTPALSTSRDWDVDEATGQ